MVESQLKSDKAEVEHEFMMIDTDGNEIGLGARGVFEKAAAGDTSAIAVLEEVKSIICSLLIFSKSMQSRNIIRRLIIFM